MEYQVFLSDDCDRSPALGDYLADVWNMTAEEFMDYVTLCRVDSKHLGVDDTKGQGPDR